MATIVEKFLNYFMTNDYKREDNSAMVKYYNTNFDLLIQKRKDGRMSDSCVVIDKRKQPSIIYNDIGIAWDRLYVS